MCLLTFEARDKNVDVDTKKKNGMENGKCGV